MKNFLLILKRHLLSPAFWQMFFGILGGSIVALVILTGVLSSGEKYLGSWHQLQANVYPEPDEIPDGNIPTGKLESEFLPAFIDIILALMSTVVLGVLLTSATLYIIHFGDEEQLKTAKGLWKWGIAGVLIMVVAYALVEGLTRLTFLRT